MKRGIFHKASIDVCLAEMVLATPIRPTTLVFAAGEEVVVAVPKQAAGDAGEYQFLFRVDEYEGDNPDKADSLFGRPAWRHFYRLGSATTVTPFSLDDLIAMAGPRGPEIWERYHGQTQHHRIIRDVYPRGRRAVPGVSTAGHRAGMGGNARGERKRVVANSTPGAGPDSRAGDSSVTRPEPSERANRAGPAVSPGTKPATQH